MPSTTVKSSLNFSFVLKQLKLVKSVWKHCKKPVDLCLGWRSSELQSLPNCFQSGGKNLTIYHLIVTIWQSDGQTQLNVKRIGVGGTVLLTVKNGEVGGCVLGLWTFSPGLSCSPQGCLHCCRQRSQSMGIRSPWGFHLKQLWLSKIFTSASEPPTILCVFFIPHLHVPFEVPGPVLTKLNYLTYSRRQKTHKHKHTE